MKRIAKFEKVSKEQYEKDSDVLAYDEIILPKRATRGSAGYDFFMPFNLVLAPKEEIKICTGIRCKIDEGWVLKIYPRSSLGFKYRMGLCNTVGIIDSDYYVNIDNDGHIMIQVLNFGDSDVLIKKDERIAQGVFLKYLLADDDNTSESRLGGFGSTK